MSTVATKTQNAGDTFAANAVVVALTVYQYGENRKIATSEIDLGQSAEGEKPDPEMVSAHKRLFKDCKELKAVREYLNDTKQFVVRRSLPSMFKGGVYLIPTSQVEAVDNWLIERNAGLPTVVKAFADVLETRIEENKKRLANLSHDPEWPTVSQIMNAYRFEWRFLTFDTPSALKGLSRGLWEREAEKARASIVEVREAGETLLRLKMQELVARMVDRLTPDADGKPKVFRNTLVPNLSEFLDVFDSRNEIVQDAELARLATRAKMLLDGVDSEMLRNEEGVRNAVVGGFAKIQSALDTMVTKKPTRQIDFTDE